MEDESPQDGTVTPQTPKTNGLSLTEYTANPTPPNEKQNHKSLALSQIPEDYLLPNGYPDVRSLHSVVQWNSTNV